MSFAIKAIVHKEFVLESQRVNSTYCCDVSGRLHEYLLRVRPELQQQKNLLLHYDNALFHTFLSTS
jgi:hypothetical protein